jgi:hypothetical protein
MFRDQHAGRNHNINIYNSSFARVEDFKYLGKTLTNQNSIQEEMKSILKPGSACCDSVRNFIFQFATKTLKIKIHRTIILPVNFLCV